MAISKRLAGRVTLMLVLVGGYTLGMQAQSRQEPGLFTDAPSVVRQWMAPGIGSGGAGRDEQVGAEVYQYSWTTDRPYETVWRFYAGKIGLANYDSDAATTFTNGGERTSGSGGVTNVISETHRQSLFSKRTTRYTISACLSQVKGDKTVVMLTITSR